MREPLVIPVGATAQRPEWSALPDLVRTAIEQELGGRVASGRSQGSGFTPGFASRLRLDDGRRFFVKATDRALGWLADAYTDEVTNLSLLPAAVPAPRLRSSFEAAGWLVLVFDDIDGRPPARPWSRGEADRVLTAAAVMAKELDPAPPGRVWQSLAAVRGGNGRRRSPRSARGACCRS